MSITHELEPPSATAILAPNFKPSERLAEQIISDLSAADSTLVTIARRANTTLESLCLWLTRPDIAARLQAVHTVRCICIRNKLAKYSDSMMDCCQSIIECYHNSASHLLFQDNDLRGHAILARKSSNALLANRILLHLAKHFNPNPPRRRERAPAAPAPTPAPSGPSPLPNPLPHPHLLPSPSNPTDTFPSLPRLADPSIFNFSPLSSSFSVTLPVHPAPQPPTHNNALTNPASAAPAASAAPSPSDPSYPCSSVAPPPSASSVAPSVPPKSEIPNPKSAIPSDPFHPRSSVAKFSSSASASPPDLRSPRSSAADPPPRPRCAAACTNCNCPTSDISHLTSDIPHRAREPTLAPA